MQTSRNQKSLAFLKRQLGTRLSTQECSRSAPRSCGVQRRRSRSARNDTDRSPQKHASASDQRNGSNHGGWADLSRTSSCRNEALVYSYVKLANNHQLSEEDEALPLVGKMMICVTAIATATWRAGNGECLRQKQVCYCCCSWLKVGITLEDHLWWVAKVTVTVGTWGK